jgi:hypothetical protein
MIDTASYRQVTTEAANRLAEGSASPMARDMIAAQITHNVNALCDEVERLRGEVAKWDATAQALNLRLHNAGVQIGRLQYGAERAVVEINARRYAEAKRMLRLALKPDADPATP